MSEPPDSLVAPLTDEERRHVDLIAEPYRALRFPVSFARAVARLDYLEAENARLRAALEAIDRLGSDELESAEELVGRMQVYADKALDS